MPSRPAPTLPRAEHVRQLKKVFGPLSPGFVADELGCTVEQAAILLYGAGAQAHCWVRVGDVAGLAGVPATDVDAWLRRHHLPFLTTRSVKRPVPALLHIVDAALFLQAAARPFPHPAWAYLPRVKAPQARSVTSAQAAPTADVDWQLAQRTAWPVTVERLAEALYGTRSAQALQQTRRLTRIWAAQGRIVAFARGLYDRVRPDLILAPSGYGRSLLPKASVASLQAHHPEVRHWPSTALASAWRAYSRLYGAALLPVLDRREPTFLEYLTIRQLHPERELKLGARYDALCKDASRYRLVAAPAPPAPAPVTAENIQAGRVDFQALVAATRAQLQLDADRAQASRQRRSHPPTTAGGSGKVR